MPLKILYGLPIAINKIADMSTLRDEISAHGAVVRILIDHPDQVRTLEEFERQQTDFKEMVSVCEGRWWPEVTMNFHPDPPILTKA